MKLFAMTMMIVMGLSANAQSISISGGKRVAAADYLSLRYTHFSNQPFKASLSGFMERSHKNYLQFSAFGIDFLYLSDPLQNPYPKKLFSLGGGIGACWLTEREPWLYKDWPFTKRSSFGLVGEISGNCQLSSSFSVSLWGQQKILFNPAIGNTRWLAGLRLAHLL